MAKEPAEAASRIIPACEPGTCPLLAGGPSGIERVPRFTFYPW
jgi:hypothetical protein